jgi:exodeoxyribonuclease VII small subunit
VVVPHARRYLLATRLTRGGLLRVINVRYGERLPVSPAPQMIDLAFMAKNNSAETELSFEQALARLEQIARDLEDGNLGLEESLTCYEEGVKRLKTCHRMLAQAERKIELLSGVDAQGNPITQPFDDEATTLEEKAEGRSRRRSSSTARVRGEKKTDDTDDRLDEPPRLF